MSNPSRNSKDEKNQDSDSPIKLSTTYSKIKETGKHGFIYGLTNTLTLAVGLVLIPVYTRYFVPAEYGVLALVLMTLSIFGTIFSLGITSALFRFYFESDDEKSKKNVANTAFTITLLSSVSLAVIGIFISPLLSEFLFATTGYELHFQLMFFTTAFTTLLQMPLAVFRAERRSKEYAIFNISDFILKLGIIIFLVVFMGWGILGVIVGRFVTTGIFALVCVFYLREFFSPRFSPAVAKELIRFGTPLLFMNLSVFVLTWFDRYFLNLFCSLEDVGIYNIGYQIGMVTLTFLLTPFTLIWSPMRFEVMHQKNADDYYRKIFTYFIAFGLFFFLGLSLLAIDGIKIIAGSAYWSAYIVIPWICLAYVFHGFNAAVNLGIDFKKKTEYQAYIFAFGAILNVGLNLYFIPIYGMIGAAFTTLVSYVVMFVLYYYVNQRLYPIRYEWRRVGLLALWAGMIFAVGWFLPVTYIANIFGFGTEGINGTLFGLSLRIAIVLLYPFGLWFGGLFEESEKAGLKRLLKEAKQKFMPSKEVVDYRSNQ